MSILGTISKAFTAATSFVWRRVFCPIFRFAYYALIAFLVLWAFTVVTLVATHICLIFNKGPLEIFRWWPDLSLGLLFGRTATQLAEHQYSALVSDMIAAFAFIVTVGAVVQARLYKRNLRRRLQRELGIEASPITQKGKDDLEWMLQHYRTAEHVTIFAGSFDWLGQNGEMRDQIIKLAKEGNLELVSRRTKAEVDKSLEKDTELYTALSTLSDHFRCESELNGVTCTMIRALGTPSKFLYRSSTTDPDKAFNACVFTNTEQSRELLHILSQLTKAEHWGKPAVD